MRKHELVFGLGPAGTGKTYLAVAVGVSLLLDGQVDRLILTRPAVEAGERLGFLPGDLNEKIDPYMRPMYDALYDVMPGDKVHRRRDVGDIEVAAARLHARPHPGQRLHHPGRGAEYDNHADEDVSEPGWARIPAWSWTGDPSQVDLPLGQKSGLKDSLEILSDLEGVALVRFGHRDVVRHPMVTRVVQAYEARDQSLIKREPDEP